MATIPITASSGTPRSASSATTTPMGRTEEATPITSASPNTAARFRTVSGRERSRSVMRRQNHENSANAMNGGSRPSKRCPRLRRFMPPVGQRFVDGPAAGVVKGQHLQNQHGHPVHGLTSGTSASRLVMRRTPSLGDVPRDVRPTRGPLRPPDRRAAEEEDDTSPARATSRVAAIGPAPRTPHPRRSSTACIRQTPLPRPAGRRLASVPARERGGGPGHR